MSLGEAYTLGVKLSADITSLRQELGQGTTLVNQFSSAAVEAMNRASAALERSAGALEKASTRTTTATQRQSQQTEQATKRTSNAFDDYMRRATKAQEQVANESERSSSRTSTALGSVQGSLLRLTGFAGFAMLAKQIGQVGFGFHEFTQNTTIGLTTLLGSAEQARSFMADILDFAKQTPYAFTDMTEQAQRLLTYGFQAADIIPILRAVGDVATGMGKGVVGIEVITRALGQINAKGRLQSQELLQLSEAGVNGLAILANQAGVTNMEFQKLIERGLVPADQAVWGLVEGMKNGTDGINGQTAAFGGLMAQIKGAGGITATLDSARTGFRNASAALTESLLPAYIGLVRTATSGLGIIKDTADVFNGLPTPVRNAALAFAAAATAARLLNVEAKARVAWQGITTAWQTARVQADLMALGAGRTRVALGAIRATAGAAGSALMGAFGGPVGLAIGAAAAAVAVFAGQSANAEARARGYADAVKLIGDEAEIAARKVALNRFITGDDADWGFFQKITTGYDSIADAAAGLGQDVGAMADAVTGSDAEFQAYRKTLTDLRDSFAFDTKGDQNAISELIIKLDQQRAGLKRAGHEQAQFEATSDDATDATNRFTGATRDSADATRQWSEEQQKAITAAGEAAEKAVDATNKLATANLNLTTAKDVEDALRQVEDASRRVQDSEDALTRSREAGADTSDLVRAEEAVEEARRTHQATIDSLADVEARRDPVEQYRLQVEEMLEQARTFAADVQKLADQGLNAQSLLDLIVAGPEGSADVRKALLSDGTLIDLANAAQTEMDGLGSQIKTAAEVAQAALEAGGEAVGANIGVGIRAQLAAEGHASVRELAFAIGEQEDDVRKAGELLGLAFMAGFRGEEWEFADILKAPTRKGGGGSFYTGGTVGLMPGYTPGRDIFTISVGGGEAVMRPEWAKAMGPGYINMMNRIAATAGTSGVRAAMNRYLGGFKDGGTVGGAPQVVTVPVTSTHERYSPISIGTVIAADVADFERQARDRRRTRNIFGGTRG